VPVAEITDALPQPAQRIVERLREGDIFLYSAGLAFYALVSLAPLTIVALWLTSLVVGDDAVLAIGRRLADVAPSKLDIEGLFEQLASVSTRAGLGAVVTALWPATSYGAGLRRAFNQLASAGKEELRGLRGRALALAFISVSPVLALFGLVSSYLITGLFDGALRVVGWALAVGFGFVISITLIGISYRLFTPERIGRDAIVRGAITAAAGIAVVSFVYLVYLRLATNFEEHYASSGLAAAVLLAVWLFLSNAFVLVGYQVASEENRRT
jgi:YihY family inner membrane protein